MIHLLVIIISLSVFGRDQPEFLVWGGLISARVKAKIVEANKKITPTAGSFF